MLTIEIALPKPLDAELVTVLEPGVNMALDLLMERVTRYPPPRPGSSYVRGGPGSQDLGHQWTTKVATGSDWIEGEIDNKVSYGPYVQDSELQAWMHQGRWDTIQGITEQETAHIEAIFLVLLEKL